MWFLGAGASAGAGLPSGSTLTWEFKRAIYCNAERIPPTRFPDLYDPSFQGLVQSYFDSKSSFPPLGHADEYSVYFEAYLPDERDRRRFLDARLQGCKPSYGHICFAALMTLDRIRVIWTTNFDQLIERACSHVSIVDKLPRLLAVAGLEQPDKASDLLRDESWPLLLKLHGDFLYRKLKNTAPELQQQDVTLRHHLADECGRRGLAITGYSGRDASIMNTLRDGLQSKTPFPHGLFWFIRPGEHPMPEVEELLSDAQNKNVQAALIEVNTFDELMADLFLPHQDTLTDIGDIVKAARPKRQRMPLSYVTGASWPVLRTNALHIQTYPASCTVFQATVGNTAEVKALTAPYAAEMVAMRRQKGVIAFGSRARLTTVFEKCNPTGFDRHPIEERRLCYDCAELSLLYHALLQGMANKAGLRRSLNAKGRFLFAPTAKTFDGAELGALRSIKSAGVWSPKAGACLHEAIEVSLDFRDQRFWLLLFPTIVVTVDGHTPYREGDRSELVRESLASRYNRQSNEILQMWVGFLQRNFGTPLTVSFPSETERESEFTISATTAYARRA
jgi:hypothetical protein